MIAYAAAPQLNRIVAAGFEVRAAALPAPMIGEPMKNSAIQSLANDLCRRAGLIGRYGEASPPMVALMQLAASRCLDVLNRDATVHARYAEIAKMFGAASAVDAARHDISCKAELKGAPLLARLPRELAEGVFSEAMRQKLGGSEALFRCHCAWSDDPESNDGKRWIAASVLAMRLVNDRLAALAATPLVFEPAGGAWFEMEFIHALA